jgi:iron-sulfur cluster repair protein YtfE (RIC family)
MTETTAARPRPNTRDMVAVHQVFRDSFGCSAQLVGSASGDNPDRVAAVASYYANVLAFLHAHHESEDALIWPKLVERAPDQAELITRIAGQHDGVLTSLKAAEIRLADWVADPNIERGAALAVALATLGAELSLHLDEEERHILPIAAECLTVEEWAELPGHGMRLFAGDKQWLVLGLIQEQMPPQAVAEMDDRLPPPVREFWTTAGRPRFEAFVADLRS